MRERREHRPVARRASLLLAKVVAWAVVPLYAAGMVVIWVGERALDTRDGGSYAENLSLFVGIGAFAVVGALLVARLPANAVGWVLASVALMLSLFPAADIYAAYTIETRGSPDPLSVLAAWGQGSSWLLSLILILVFLPLLFPDGRLPSRRWWPVAALAGLAATVAMVLSGLSETLTLQSTGYRIENPIGIEGLAYVEELPIFIYLALIYVVCILSAFASVVVRYRRARGAERQQLKWFVLAATSLPLAAFADILPSILQDLAFAVAFVGMPGAIGIAILRHRLYDIDLVINRALVYASLTVALILVYLSTVTAAQSTLILLTGQPEQPQLVVVASTLLIAALFNPLRRRIQSAVDRRFYRQKYDAARTITGFASRMRDATDLDALQTDLLGTARQTVQPEHASLWLRTTGRSRTALAESPTEATERATTDGSNARTSRDLRRESESG